MFISLFAGLREPALSLSFAVKSDYFEAEKLEQLASRYGLFRSTPVW